MQEEARLLEVEGNGRSCLPWTREDRAILRETFPLDGPPPRKEDSTLQLLAGVIDRTPGAVVTKWYDEKEKKGGRPYSEAKRTPAANKPYSLAEDQAIVLAFSLDGPNPRSRDVCKLAKELGRPPRGVYKRWRRLRGDYIEKHYPMYEYHDKKREEAVDVPIASGGSKTIACPHCGGGLLFMEGRLYMEVRHEET